MKYEVEGLVYDEDTGVFTKKGVEVGAVAKNGYVVIRFLGKVHYAHRIAIFITTGKWPEADVDHINRNRSDNRICNLRLATRRQNLSNKLSRNKHFVKGVFMHPNAKRRKRYGAMICIEGEREFLGWHLTAEEAGNAYRIAAEKNYGEFANTGHAHLVEDFMRGKTL